MPGMHSSHRRAVMQDLMKTHTPENKRLKERDELFKLPVYLFSPSRAITWMPSDANPYQITKYQLFGAETRNELFPEFPLLFPKPVPIQTLKKCSLPAITKQATQPAASQIGEEQEAQAQQTTIC